VQAVKVTVGMASH